MARTRALTPGAKVGTSAFVAVSNAAMWLRG